MCGGREWIARQGLQLGQWGDGEPFVCNVRSMSRTSRRLSRKALPAREQRASMRSSDFVFRQPLRLATSSDYFSRALLDRRRTQSQSTQDHSLCWASIDHEPAKSLPPRSPAWSDASSVGELCDAKKPFLSFVAARNPTPTEPVLAVRSCRSPPTTFFGSKHQRSSRSSAFRTLSDWIPSPRRASDGLVQSSPGSQAGRKVGASRRRY